VFDTADPPFRAPREFFRCDECYRWARELAARRAPLEQTARFLELARLDGKIDGLKITYWEGEARRQLGVETAAAVASLEQVGEVPASDPRLKSDRELKDLWYAAHAALGRHYEQLGRDADGPEAVAAYQQAIHHFRKCLVDGRADTTNRYRLAQNYQALASLNDALADAPSRAVEYFAQLAVMNTKYAQQAKEAIAELGGAAAMLTVVFERAKTAEQSYLAKINGDQFSRAEWLERLYPGSAELKFLKDMARQRDLGPKRGDLAAPYERLADHYANQGNPQAAARLREIRNKIPPVGGSH
jgi:hypothetical protein